MSRTPAVTQENSIPGSRVLSLVTVERELHPIRGIVPTEFLSHEISPEINS